MSAGLRTGKFLTSGAQPRFFVLIATAGGLGYLPKAPGTWGSLGGTFLAILMVWVTYRRLSDFDLPGNFWTSGLIPSLWRCCLVAVLVAALGVWAADRAAR